MRPQIGILYEHPEWFSPLFAELDRLEVSFDHLLAHEHMFDPTDLLGTHMTVINRMSPSAYLRGHGNAIFYVAEYLSYLDTIGTNVINGKSAYEIEISKTKQLTLLTNIGVNFPKARTIDHLGQAPAAAEGLVYPVIVKPNIGGSGAYIQKFDDAESLRAAATDNTISLGIDHTALVQEFLPMRDGYIVRVEVLEGKVLYAIKVYPDPVKGFNLCPADICRPEDAQPGDQEATSRADDPAVPAVKTALQIEAYEPSREIRNTVVNIARHSHLDVGGIECLVNDRDGEVYYYDVNAVSNFVTDAEAIIGFNPYASLAEYIARRAERAAIAAA